ncbi:15-hydroxyprostaglandin dehydrogenase [Pleurostoma richardsiae]|uniref:15-hydroxyprostaglandin dehydrogenase n=1 Tax=Pleurostoma richardsiae TaxID=41990 RepID=A0AA38RAU2_9PEZI|nr:15-hydroxyprostaglandin dehydrogenase [Pleurostoma richardsiae]
MSLNQTNNHPAKPERKSILITGGASGIGLELSRHFAAEGHQIAVLDVNETAGRSVVAELASSYPEAKLTFKRCDVSLWPEQMVAFQEVFREHGSRLDIVMANAGISEQGSSSIVAVEDDIPAEPQLKAINVNLIGVIYSIKLAVHYMNKNRTEGSNGLKGSIICTASNAGLYPFPVAPLYAASKAGVIGLVRSTAKVFQKSKIQINALAPAVLETNIAPNKKLFEKMIVTPMTTLTRGVSQLLSDPTITGEVAEIHGEHVTLRPPYGYVDEDSAANLETFWSLGYA